jgi:hypothetical protein
MSFELQLRRAPGSAALSERAVRGALERLHDPRAPGVILREGAIRFARTLSADDDSCAAIAVTFSRNGSCVVASTRAFAAPLLSWCFHALAKTIGCVLYDPQEGTRAEPDPDAFLDAALAVLEQHEREIQSDRAYQGGQPTQASSEGRELLAWLQREGHIVIDGDVGALAGSLPVDDARAAYETLLESDEVAEVFVSESEFEGLFARFKSL